MPLGLPLAAFGPFINEDKAVDKDMPNSFDPCIEQPVETDWTTMDGVFIKQILIKDAETYLPQHSHDFDHATMVAVGAVTVWKDSVFDRDYEAPTIIEIPAGVKHTFMSKVAGTVLYCIHRIDRTGEVEIKEHHELPTMVVQGGIVKGLYGPLHSEDEVL